jgi:hypothetical protein
VCTVSPDANPCVGGALVLVPSSLDCVGRYAGGVCTVLPDSEPCAGYALVLAPSSLDDVYLTGGLRVKSSKPRKLLLRELILTCKLDKNQ